MNGVHPTMPQITGRTALVAHLGFPTESFKAPMIYNPWFAARGIDAVVVPMGVRAEDYPAFLPLVFRLSNICGALVTMPHKVTTVGLVDHVTPTAAIAGAAQSAGEKHQLPLVIFGLLVSIPIIVWGSQLVLKLMDRFPIIITLGGMLLGWIAGTMAHTDPALVPYIPQDRAVHYAMGVAGALLVLAIGKLVQSRRRGPPAAGAA